MIKHLCKLFLFSFSAAHAVEMAPCPQGTEMMTKSEEGARIRYCGVESPDCFGQMGKERVFFFKGDRKACGILEGPTYYLYNDKSVLIMRYRDGKMSGASESFAPNGQKILEENYSDGKIHGVKKGWYPENGALRSQEKYVDGFPQGESLEWHPNGKVKRKAYYKDGKLEGTWEEFYENEKKLRETVFASGRWSGVYREWYSNGNKFSEGIYQNGKISKPLQYFRRDGSEIKAASTPRSPAYIPEGVLPSFFADFDANGYLDAVVPNREKKTTEVVLLGPSGKAKKEYLEEIGLEIYTARSSMGQFGEPPSARDGLVIWEKESGNSSVYLYDFDKEVFVRSDHASDAY